MSKSSTRRGESSYLSLQAKQVLIDLEAMEMTHTAKSAAVREGVSFEVFNSRSFNEDVSKNKPNFTITAITDNSDLTISKKVDNTERISFCNENITEMEYQTNHTIKSVLSDPDKGVS